MADTLVCPNCSYEIEVSATLSAQLRENLRKEFEAEARRKENEIAGREEGVRLKEQELETCRRAIGQEVLNRLAQERIPLLQEAKSKAKESVALEIQDLQDQISDAKTKLGEAQEAELQVRKERRELEDQKRELELTVSRELDEGRKKIREEAKEEAVEENRLREADKDRLIDGLRRQINDLKRQSEQGSQQAQGEVMEVELEDLLCQHFPFDTVQPVPKGTHGGDVLHHVHDSGGQMCGMILWESKRTKAWSDGWLAKLRDDQRAAKAHLAALLTAEMPKSLATFGCIDGIWVTNRSCLVGLAAALRAGLIEAARTRRSVEGRQTKVELVYQYLSGPEFRQRIEGIVEAFVTLKDDLEVEKRSLRRLWAKREKQLERAAINTAGLYGDLGGIIGTNLPQIAKLELPAIEADFAANGDMPADKLVAESPF